jgi:molybdopterin converting factor small subunit
MPITIQLPKVLADLAGSRSIEANGATLGEAVDEVAGRFPAIASRLRDDRGEPYEYVVFYLNDEDIRLIGGFEASITDGDEVTIVPAVAGG